MICSTPVRLQGESYTPWYIGFDSMEAPHIRVQIRDEMQRWCRENFTGTFFFTVTKHLYIQHEDDAMLFYLRYR